jgi:uncharacterized protein
MQQITETDWRTVCRQHAQEQAQTEARRKWQIEPDRPLPFNYRWEHVQEVVRLALWLARTLGADLEIVEAAAWLHDVRKEQPQHALVGAEAAAQILPTTDFPVSKIATVAEVIRKHEGMLRPKQADPLLPLEAAILWDADKLSKLGVQALALLLSSENLIGQTLAERRLGFEDFVHNTLNRTVKSMNTPPARQVAEQRYNSMVTMLNTWAEEELVYNSKV